MEDLNKKKEQAIFWNSSFRVVGHRMVRGTAEGREGEREGQSLNSVGHCHAESQGIGGNDQ